MSTADWSNEEAEKIYQIGRWGEGYFTINDKGHLSVLPQKRPEGPVIDIYEVIKEIEAKNMGLPVVVRFHDILHAQVKNLNETFNKIIEEADYRGNYKGVYPIKVNQMREVVEEIIHAGSSYSFGLEAGSKAELLSVLAYNDNKDSLTILNGYKDENFLRLALLGNKMGRNVIVVIEKFSELSALLRLAKEMKVTPRLGIRVRMSVKGRGKWLESSGDRAKFGLTIPEVLMTVEALKQEKLISSFKLFHFHIGSQITDIKTIKDSIAEGARIYAKLVKLGIYIEHFDLGGGLGVDYDGSRSTKNSSKNYSIDEYATDVIYGVKQVCDLEGVPHPNIVTESGRAITAHHSCVITKVIDKIETTVTNFNTDKSSDEHILVSNMREVFEELSSKNAQEMYNDALQIKEDASNAFRLGILNLDERAKIEVLYWKINKKISQKLKKMKFIPEDLQGLDNSMASQYLCNFSVFQSVVDSWAIEQLLPVVPITRLHERPSNYCSIADITCDSDGKIQHFISGEGEEFSRTLPLHDLNEGEDYYVGVFLTGAYQDVMGDMHNLFGRLNEVHVFSDKGEAGDFYIEESIRGSSSEQVLATMQYNPEYMVYVIKKEIDRQMQKGKISPREGVRLVDFYAECLKSYTYLN